MEERKNDVGFLIRKLSNALRKTRELEEKNSVDDTSGITMLQRWVLWYLVNNQDHDVWQRELETKLNIGKSTLTEVLNLMERDSLVRREVSQEDGRCKRIVLTEKSLRINNSISSGIRATEERLRSGIPDEDMEVFLRTIRKMIKNITECNEQEKGDYDD